MFYIYNLFYSNKQLPPGQDAAETKVGIKETHTRLCKGVYKGDMIKAPPANMQEPYSNLFVCPHFLVTW